MRDLIIHPRYPGLGDHLFFSHLPRIAIESGTYDRVFISKRAEYRQQAICSLVWEHNPFVSGFVDEEGVDLGFVLPSSPSENLLDTIMLAYGLDDGQRWHEPEIFYKPKLRPELVNSSLYDPNFVSNCGKIRVGDIDKYMRKNKVKIDYYMNPLSANAVNIEHYKKYAQLRTDLFQFVDVLFSCATVYCLVTGTATLCAALKKKTYVFYTERVGEAFLHSKNNSYIKVRPDTDNQLIQIARKIKSLFHYY